MMWFRIPKEEAQQPQKGTYRDWKPLLSKEGKAQCVYCTIRESSFGGIRNYHVEHFRPKSLEEFKNLENDIKNLFHCCSICNSFKGSDWKSNPETANDCDLFYYDPSVKDYKEIFFISEENDFIVDGQCVSSKYMINKLFLNRPQLLLERKEKVFSERLLKLRNELNELAKKLISSGLSKTEKGSEFLNQTLDMLTQSGTRFSELRNSIPYSEDDIRRK
ncbi:MAG: hypothetical protein ACMZ7B_01875 [Balneola sp.]